LLQRIHPVRGPDGNAEDQVAADGRLRRRGGRFRHGTKLLRFRPDKAPKQCTIDQVEQESRVSPLDLLSAT
jgi:hypothetical protein